MAKPGGKPAALTGQQADLREWVRKLVAARASSRPLRRGDRKTLLGNDGNLWVYAYQTAPGEIAIVAINRGGEVSSRTVNAQPLSLGAVTGFTSVLGTGWAARSGSDLSISLGAGEAALFVSN
jgi:hypothetical protein